METELQVNPTWWDIAESRSLKIRSSYMEFYQGIIEKYHITYCKSNTSYDLFKENCFSETSENQEKIHSVIRPPTAASTSVNCFCPMSPIFSDQALSDTVYENDLMFSYQNYLFEDRGILI